MGEPEVAVVVGVGPGLGAALALRFAKAGMNVALAARQLERVEGIAIDCCNIDHRGSRSARQHHLVHWRHRKPARQRPVP